VSTFLSTMSDVGDLPVLTFGNYCVLKAELLSGLFFSVVAHVFSNAGPHEVTDF